MNFKPSKMKLSAFMLSATPDAQFTGSSLPKEQSQESHLHRLDTAKIILKLEKVLLSKSIPTSDDLHKSLQQQDQSDRLLH